MADRRGARNVAAMTRLALATLLLVATYLIGAVIAALTDVGTLADAAANGTKLSAPGFLIALELFAAYLVFRGRIAGAAILLGTSGLSTAAFAFDGDFAHDSLAAGHGLWQSLEVGLALVVFGLAARVLIRRRRRPAVATGA